MQQDDNGSDQEGDFQDADCDQQVEKITHLKALLEIEEMKLFEAMRNAKNNLRVANQPSFRGCKKTLRTYIRMLLFSLLRF